MQSEVLVKLPSRWSRLVMTMLHGIDHVVRFHPLLMQLVELPREPLHALAPIATSPTPLSKFWDVDVLSYSDTVTRAKARPSITVPPCLLLFPPGTGI